MKSLVLLLLGLFCYVSSVGQGFLVTVSPKVGDPNILVFKLNSINDYLGPVDNQWQGWQLVISWEISANLPCDNTLVPVIQPLDGIPNWTKIPNPVPQDGICYLEFNKASFTQSYNSNYSQDIFEITLGGNLTYNDLMFPLEADLPATAGPGLTNILGDQFIGYDLTALPITLTRFDAVLNKEGWVDLVWETESETNADGFVVERSLDGRKWEMIDKLSARGSVDSRAEYRTKDLRPEAGYNYYRLKMLDLDGTFEYSPLRSVFSLVRDRGLSTYPNPVDRELFIATDRLLEDVRVEIFSMKGESVYFEKMDYLAQNASTSILLPQLASGAYNVVISQKNGEVVFTDVLIKK